jgi:hypothetical protein
VYSLSLVKKSLDENLELKPDRIEKAVQTLKMFKNICPATLTEEIKIQSVSDITPEIKINHALSATNQFKKAFKKKLYIF